MPIRVEEPRYNFTRKEVKVLHGVFSENECLELIQLSEKQVYSEALIHCGATTYIDKSYRDSDRVIIDDHAIAAEVFKRIQPYLPARLKAWVLIGVNERLRFLRYGPGQKFEMHRDGCYARPGTKECSQLTLQVYLNGGEGQLEGGETALYNDNFTELHTVKPRAGMVLIFDHDLYHEGCPVETGLKYTIRADVMYKHA